MLFFNTRHMFSKIRLSILSFWCAIILVLFIVFKMISIYFGNNALNTSKYGHIDYLAIFPQGWAFFTKPSREPLVHIFKCSGKNITPLNLKNFSVKSIFGISRHNRVVNVEGGTIFSKIMEDSLVGVKIKAQNTEELYKKLNIDALKFKNLSLNKAYIPDFKGKYLFVSQELLPWPLIHKKPEYESEFTVYAINLDYK